MKKYIYLDNNATTPLDPRVLKEMQQDFGPPYNPSSAHFLGKEAQHLLQQARIMIASILKVQKEEIIFTSGGSEALNMLIRGSISSPSSHIITTNIEHACVYQTVLDLQKKGSKITFIETGPFGAVTKKQIEKAIQPNTKLIVLSAVNSETGVETDIQSIATIAEKKNIPFIVDGVALLGKKRFSISNGVTGMGFSSHKIHGPKGVGFAFLKKGFPLHPLILGGGQEFQKRAGTENLSGILGMTKALQLADANIDQYNKKMQQLRDHFEKNLSQTLDISINGQGKRIPNVSNIAFHGIDGEDLLILLDQKKIAASHGSACSSFSLELSRVLLNMGFPKKRVASSLRFSFSRYNTMEEVEKAVKIIIKAVNALL